MKIKEYMKVELPSTCKKENVELVCSFVANFAEQYGATRYVWQDIKTCVSEAVENAIEYAYPDKEGVISVCCRILKDNTLEVIIKDKGVGIENVTEAIAPLFTTDSGEQHSGLGFTVMDSFMDEMRVKSTSGKGTTVRLRKKINKRLKL